MMGLYSFHHCTWLYLALPDRARPKCFCIYRLQCSKALRGWSGISVSTYSKSTALRCLQNQCEREKLMAIVGVFLKLAGLAKPRDATELKEVEKHPQKSCSKPNQGLTKTQKNILRLR